jgi:predicted RNA binding protein YcfA (HicA-like mRNA interferase family)
MSRLPALTPRQVRRALQRAGFFIHRTSGGHHILKHPRDPKLRVTVPEHRTDLKRKTLLTIIQQSGLTVDEFIDLL